MYIYVYLMNLCACPAPLMKQSFFAKAKKSIVFSFFFLKVTKVVPPKFCCCSHLPLMSGTFEMLGVAPIPLETAALTPSPRHQVPPPPSSRLRQLFPRVPRPTTMPAQLSTIGGDRLLVPKRAVQSSSVSLREQKRPADGSSRQLSRRSAHGEDLPRSGVCAMVLCVCLHFFFEFSRNVWGTTSIVLCIVFFATAGVFAPSVAAETVPELKMARYISRFLYNNVCVFSVGAGAGVFG